MNNQNGPKLPTANNGGAKTPSFNANSGDKQNEKMAGIQSRKAATPSGKRAEDYNRGKGLSKNSSSSNNQAAKEKLNNTKNNLQNIKKRFAKEGIKKAAAAEGIPEPVTNAVLNSKLGDQLVDAALAGGDPKEALNQIRKAGNLAKGAAAKALSGSEAASDALKPDSDKTLEEKSDERESKKLANGDINFEFSLKTLRFLVILTPIITTLMMVVMMAIAGISDSKVSSMILSELASNERKKILEKIGLGSGEGTLAYNTVGKGDEDFPDEYYDRIENLGNVFSSNGKCKDEECYTREEFLYYLKVADISLRYELKYGVTLDWYLISATNLYTMDTNEITMGKNIGGYDKDTVEDLDTPSMLDWDNDFKNMPGYTYLAENNSTYDLQILAKNMVTKKTFQSCSNNGVVSKTQEDTDVEDKYFENGDKKLVCAAGEQYNIYSTYSLDKDKFDSFMLEYIDKRLLKESKKSNGNCYYWPLENAVGTISSKFGLREAPTEGASTNHGGVDIGVPEHTHIVATRAGTVTVAGEMSGFGYAVYIDHGDGMVSKYGHIRSDEIQVKVGDHVTQGQYIAGSGNTGISTGPHLHFQLEMDGQKVDPLDYVSQEDPTPSSCSVDGNSLSDAFVKLALAQINDPDGINGKKYWQFMGFGDRVAWCASYVSWVVFNTTYDGQRLYDIINYKNAGVGGWMNTFKEGGKTGQLKFVYNDNCSKYSGKNGSGSNYIPKQGDMIFFDWEATWNGNFPVSYGTGQDHIGIVQYTQGNTIYTIEGNTSNKVAERQYALDSCKVIGFGSWY